jgi:hypothetical protein
MTEFRCHPERLKPRRIYASLLIINNAQILRFAQNDIAMEILEMK